VCGYQAVPSVCRCDGMKKPPSHPGGCMKGKRVGLGGRQVVSLDSGLEVFEQVGDGRFNRL